MPLLRLTDDLGFWQYRGDGLALFYSRDKLRHFRLPMRFEELAVVANRFHLKPLIPLFTEDAGFYILALSQNEIRLIQGNRYSAWEVELKDVPASLTEALRYDEPERQFQFHSKTSAGAGEDVTPFFSPTEWGWTTQKTISAGIFSKSTRGSRRCSGRTEVR